MIPYIDGYTHTHDYTTKQTLKMILFDECISAISLGSECRPIFYMIYDIQLYNYTIEN